MYDNIYVGRYNECTTNDYDVIIHCIYSSMHAPHRLLLCVYRCIIIIINNDNVSYKMLSHVCKTSELWHHYENPSVWQFDFLKLSLAVTSLLHYLKTMRWRDCDVIIYNNTYVLLFYILSDHLEIERLKSWKHDLDKGDQVQLKGTEVEGIIGIM